MGNTMPGAAAQRVLSAIGDSARTTGDGKWSARCPAHDDGTASLSIGTSDGGVLLHCHAGCSFDDVVRALGLSKAELFDDYADSLTSNRAKVLSVTVKQKAASKVYATLESAIEAVERLASRDAPGSKVVKSWDYRDADGVLVGVVTRVKAGGAPGKSFRPLCRVGDGWAVKAPQRWPLYGLERIDNAEPLYIVEGEKCADAMQRLGLTAITSAGGAKGTKRTDWRPLAGRTVYAIPDNDDAGGEYVSGVRAALAALNPPGKVIDCGKLHGYTEPGDDVADLVERAGGDATALGAVASTIRVAASAAGNAVALREAHMIDGAADVHDRRTWNDVGLGRRIVAEAAGRIRFVTDRGVWAKWTGANWVDDVTASEPVKIGKANGRRLWNEMGAEGVATSLPLVRFVMAASSRRSIDAAVAMARSEPQLEVESGKFDADPDLLNVANGILDLRTRTLRPHDPAALLTKLGGVAFDPAAKCPKWEAFIKAVTCDDPALAGFLQRSFGLALSADQSEQRIWVHHGEGSNGKGTALAVLHRVMGTYAGPAPVEILLSRRQDGDREIGVAKLAGLRLAFAQEADDGARLSEATVKALTGSDPLTGRFLYQNNFQIFPTWHLHLAVNDRPVIRGTDHGIWRRVTLVPWGHTFTDAEKRPRAQVEAELLEEGPGILNWLLDGYESWRASGLRPPEAVEAATSEYRAESDSVKAWVADACDVEAGAESPATDLFQHYGEWCKRAGYTANSQTKFGRTLDAMGHTKERPKHGRHRNRTVRLGIRLASSFVPSDESEAVYHPQSPQNDDWGAFD